MAVPAADAAEKVTWNWALYGPPRAFTVGPEHLAKAAKERSGGNFIINLRYNEQLSDAKDMLDGLKVGAFHGAVTAYSYAPAKTPLQGVLDMPVQSTELFRRIATDAVTYEIAVSFAKSLEQMLHGFQYNDGTALVHQHHAGWMPWAGALPHRIGGAMAIW